MTHQDWLTLLHVGLYMVFAFMLLVGALLFQESDTTSELGVVYSVSFSAFSDSSPYL